MVGLPKSIIKKYGISKKAWSVFRGRKGRKKSKSRTRRSKTTRRKKRNNPVRRVRRSVRRRRKRGGGKSITRSLMKWVRVGALAAPAAAIAMSGDSTQGKIEQVIEAYTGYNIPSRQMNFGSLLRGWGPFLGATLVTYGIPKLAGILRKL